MPNGRNVPSENVTKIDWVSLDSYYRYILSEDVMSTRMGAGNLKLYYKLSREKTRVVPCSQVPRGAGGGEYEIFWGERKNAKRGWKEGRSRRHEEICAPVEQRTVYCGGGCANTSVGGSVARGEGVERRDI